MLRYEEETSLSINSNKYLYRSLTILENVPNVHKDTHVS